MREKVESSRRLDLITFIQISFCINERSLPLIDAKTNLIVQTSLHAYMQPSLDIGICEKLLNA
jgi:hypothetical protein